MPPPGDLIYSPGFAAGRSRARKLLTIHDLIHLEGPSPSRLRTAYYETLVKPSIRRCGHVLTVSNASAARLRDWLDDSVQVHIAPNACADAFTVDGPSAAYGDQFVLLVGNLKTHKNPLTAFRAVARLPSHQFVVVTSDRRAAIEMARATGIERRTTVLSDVEDDTLAALYRGADALLFLSVQEGFGLPALESISCGTPVVYARSTTSVHEICGGGGLGVTDPYDVSEVVAALRACVDADVVVEVNGKYSWDVTAKRVREVIEIVCNSA